MTVYDAARFSWQKHKGQMYGDKDYFAHHIQKVVSSLEVSVDRYKLTECEVDTILITAYLHDVVEDCGVTIKEIEDTFGVEVATYVSLLTKKPEQTRDDYLQQVSSCRVSALVKLHDATINATQCFSDGDMKRFKKYLGYIGVLADKLGDVK